MSQPQSLSTEEIQRILPHRYPFLMVDRILSLEPGKRIVGVKNVTVNEPFFQGHFPGRPIMPGVLIVEAMAQVGGILGLMSTRNMSKASIYLLGIDKVRFRKLVLPGDQLVIEVEILRSGKKFWKMQATVHVDQTLVCEGEVMAAITNNEGD